MVILSVWGFVFQQSMAKQTSDEQWADEIERAITENKPELKRRAAEERRLQQEREERRRQEEFRDDFIREALLLSQGHPQILKRIQSLIEEFLYINKKEKVEKTTIRTHQLQVIRDRISKSISELEQMEKFALKAQVIAQKELEKKARLPIELEFYRQIKEATDKIFGEIKEKRWDHLFQAKIFELKRKIPELKGELEEMIKKEAITEKLVKDTEEEIKRQSYLEKEKMTDLMKLPNPLGTYSARSLNLLHKKIEEVLRTITDLKQQKGAQQVALRKLQKERFNLEAQIETLVQESKTVEEVMQESAREKGDDTAQASSAKDQSTEASVNPSVPEDKAAELDKDTNVYYFNDRFLIIVPKVIFEFNQTSELPDTSESREWQESMGEILALQNQNIAIVSSEIFYKLDENEEIDVEVPNLGLVLA